MAEASATIPTTLPRVVKVIDYIRVAISKGSKDGISIGDKFLLFELDKDILYDPETKEALGQLEITKGRGIVTHVQDHIATLQSMEKTSGKTGRRVIRRTPMGTLWALSEVMGKMNEEEVIEIPAENEVIGFNDAKMGDYAKPI